MERSPLAASLLVLGFVIGVPIMLIQRLAEGVAAVRPLDTALVVGVVIWLFISKAIIDRDSAVDPLANHKYSLRWHTQSLVDQSILGFGFEERDALVANNLGLLTMPQASIDDLMPPPIHARRGDGAVREGGDPNAPAAIPVLRTDEPATPLILATEEYIVARRDTYWSIADALFDDGRLWGTIQDLNIGREVAPGVELREGDELRIGWSIVIPLVSSEEPEENHDS